VKKTAAKKTPAKKTSAKKTAAKKTAAKKTSAKKTSAKKTPAKKTPAKKTPAKKTPAKQPAAKKSAAKKTPAKQPAAKRFESLLDAAKALAAGEVRALPRLLDAWRICPAPALGELITHFAPDELELATLRDSSVQDIIARVEGLAERDADPRIAAALAELVVQPPFTSGASRPMWTSLFDQLETRHRDPRVLERLRGVDLATRFGSTNMGSWIVPRLARTLAELDGFFAGTKLALAEDAELLALLPTASATTTTTTNDARKPTAATTEQELIEQCAAAPDADEPRLVYADWLDTVGRAEQAEFVRLQLARAREGGPPSEREQQLVDKRAAKWLAAILPALKKDSWVFERGLLARCTIYPRKGAPLELAGHCLWSTVREVVLSETGDPSPIITHPIMTNLRDVSLWTYPRGLAGLLDSDAPIERLHHVYVPNVVREKGTWAALVACERLPRLTLVELGGASVEQLAALCRGGLRRPGMRLVHGVYDLDLPMWMHALPELTGPEVGLTVVTPESEFELELATRTLRATLVREPAEGLWTVATALSTFQPQDAPLAPGSIAALELRVPVGGVVADYEDYRPVRSAAALIDAIAARCATLGLAFDMREGAWPSRYVGHYKVQL
jgi:uncharacterized protein (TIGR02996 family)